MDDTLYMYVDESGDASLSTEGPFSIGTFLSTRPIQDGFFDEALDRLKNDPDFTKQDQRTLERGHFHASFDSKNGHSHCCRAIASIDWPCEFSWVMLKKEKLTEKDRKELNTQAKIHEHLIALMGVPLLTTKRNNVELYIAERPKSFTEQSPSQWEEHFVNAILYGLTVHPMIPGAVPAFNIFVSDAMNPGVQICDFLLWAAQRKKIVDKNDQWLERANSFNKHIYRNKKFKISIDIDMDDWAINWQDFYLFERIEDITTHVDQLPPRKTEVQREEVYNAFINIERWIRCVHKNPKLVRNNVLKGRVGELIPKLDETSIQPSVAVEMAELFLLLVDHVPAYDLKNKDETAYVWLLRDICSRTCNKQFVDWFLMSKEWVRARRQILFNYPDCLTIL